MIVFGLGNPGGKYEKTRHNVGFMTVEKLAASYGMKMRKRCFSNYKWSHEEDFRIVQPLTFMNNSGIVFPSLVKEGARVIVVVDNMDLPVGRLKVRIGGSSAGHNGLKSIINEWGNDFIRIYIGIGRPAEGVDVPDHVLSEFSDEDMAVLDKVFDEAVVAIDSFRKGEKDNVIIQRANSFSAVPTV